MLSEQEYDKLLNESLDRNKTAKDRAKLAARMIIDGTYKDDDCGILRPFDNCFEMGDGKEVVKHLSSIAKKNRTLASLLLSSGDEIFNRSTHEDLFKACAFALGKASR